MTRAKRPGHQRIFAEWQCKGINARKYSHNICQPNAFTEMKQQQKKKTEPFTYNGNNVMVQDFLAHTENTTHATPTILFCIIFLYVSLSYELSHSVLGTASRKGFSLHTKRHLNARRTQKSHTHKAVRKQTHPAHLMRITAASRAALQHNCLLTFLCECESVCVVCARLQLLLYNITYWNPSVLGECTRSTAACANGLPHHHHHHPHPNTDALCAARQKD